MFYAYDIDYSTGWREPAKVPAKPMIIDGFEIRNFRVESEFAGLGFNGELVFNDQEAGERIDGQEPLVWSLNNDNNRVLFAVLPSGVKSWWLGTGSGYVLSKERPTHPENPTRVGRSFEECVADWNE